MVCIVHALAIAVVSFFRELTAYKIGNEAGVDVVTRLRVYAPNDFKFVTDAVTVCVSVALTVAFVTCCGICTLSIIRSLSVVIASSFVGASFDFKFIADSVLVCIVQALAIAVVSFVSKETVAVVVGSFSGVIASGLIGAPCNFKLVAYSVAVSIRYAFAVTVVFG